MRERCERSANDQYNNYGGRGIFVCDEWLDFGKFIADMGRRPSNYHVIERIDNDGNYEKVNCKWATPKENVRNRRTTVKVEIDGQLKSMAEWCEIFRVKFSTVAQRYYRGVRGRDLFLSGKLPYGHIRQFKEEL